MKLSQSFLLSMISAGLLTISSIATAAGPAILLTPTDDSYVRGGSYANTSYGNETLLQIKQSSTASYARKTYLKFDLSSVVGPVYQANLKLVVESSKSAGQNQLYLVPNDNWRESTLTYNNRPATGSLLKTWSSTSALDAVMNIDVTAAVQAEKAGDNVISLAIDESVSQYYSNYRSKENGYIGFSPVLEIVQQPPVAAITSVYTYTENIDFSSGNYDVVNAMTYLNDLVSRGIKLAVISVKAELLQDPTYLANFKNFLDQSIARDIQIDCRVLQNNEYTYASRHPEALAKLQKFADFLNSNNQYYLRPIRSVHYNVEPNVLPEWQAADWGANKQVRSDLMAQYLSLLTQAKHLLKDTAGLTQLKIYTSQDYYYDSKFRQGLFPEGDPKLMAASVDAIFVMDYLGTTETGLTTPEKITRIIRNVEHEVALVPTVIALRVTDFANYAQLQEVKQGIEAHFASWANFHGVALFKYSTLLSYSQQ